MWEGSFELSKRLQYITEREVQRFELRCEIAPVTDATGVNRLPYLLRARGANGTARLVEGKAGGLEWQCTMPQQGANLRFRFAHEPLILHVQHLAWQHIVPMPHCCE